MQIDEISARAMVQAKNPICWGPHQARKGTEYRSETLYTPDIAREVPSTTHRSHDYPHKLDKSYWRLKKKENGKAAAGNVSVLKDQRQWQG